MAMFEDGKGTGYLAEVDKTHRIRSRAVSESEQNEQASLGMAYTIPSGFITLTNTSESALMWLKNNETENLLITRFIASVRKSTGGTDNHARILIYYNPTGMTGGSGTDLTPVNLNFGSSNTLANTSEIGLQGASLDGATLFGGFVVPMESLTSESASIVLPKGASIGVTCVPPAGNTSLDVAVGMSTHLAPV